MSYLLDTNVVSELRKKSPDARVLRWYESARQSDAYLSVLVVGEIQRGIEGVRARDTPQAERLDSWLLGLVTMFRDRILPITLEIVTEWGRLSPLARPMPVVDGLLAATASVHRLTLVTRNVCDVARPGVRVLNPFR